MLISYLIPFTDYIWFSYALQYRFMSFLHLLLRLPFVLTFLLITYYSSFRNQSIYSTVRPSQDQKHAHNNPTMLLYFSLPFSQECIFEVSWEYMTSDTWTYWIQKKMRIWLSSVKPDIKVFGKSMTHFSLILFVLEYRHTSFYCPFALLCFADSVFINIEARPSTSKEITIHQRLRW